MSIDRPLRNFNPFLIGEASMSRMSVVVGSATFVLGALAWHPASAITITIDDFVTVQNAEVLASAPPIASAGSALAAPGVIGGERDLYVEKTAGDDDERVRARINPSGLNLLRMTIDDAKGRVVMTWDGSDGLFAPGQVSYAGLGGIDFTQALQLDLLVTFSDVGGPVKFVFWDAADLSGNTRATTTFTVPGSIPAASSVTLSKTFLSSDFTATGGTLASIFANVGAIQMEIDARAVAQEGWDARFDYVRATGTLPPTGVPEPSTLALLGLGLVGLAQRARRHRNSPTA
jgi:hypothetical protein